MEVWQVDFYRRPLQDNEGNPLWELVICDSVGGFTAREFCPQPQANAAWLTAQLQRFLHSRERPSRLQVFRPQSLSLLQAASQPLEIPVEATRRTPALKQFLQKLADQYRTLPNYVGQAGKSYDPIALHQPPPVPLPENLWGDRWRFGAIAAQDLIAAFQNRPVPVREMPEFLHPIKLGIASTVLIPGVIIDGGRRSLPLVRWLQQANPFALSYIPGDPDGLILEANLVDRWVLSTFEDTEVIAAARSFRERQQRAKGLHFLLVQPDDSGMTYTGVWLLQSELA
jgi:RNA-binding protein Tab2/Atab2